MEKFKIFTLFVFFALLIGSCGKFGSTPKKTLTEYLEAEFQFDYEKSYQYISSEDKAVKSVEEYIKLKDLSSIPESLLIRTIRDKMSYKIQDIETQEGKATAKVEVTMLDLNEMLSDVMGMAFAYAFSGLSEEEMDKEIWNKVKDKIEKGEFSMTTEVQTFELIKEKDGWKVYLGWEKQENLENLMKQAKQLQKQGDFEEAKNKYLEIIKIDSLSPEGLQASVEVLMISEEAEQLREKQAYIKNLKVGNITVGEGETQYLEKAIGVFGEIKNLGNRSLDEVEITIYCLDKKGQPIFEKTYHPVLVSDYSFGRDANAPLKPNYSRKFGFRLDDAPADWSRKVKIEVTDIEFSE